MGMTPLLWLGLAQPRGPRSADFHSLCIGRRIIFLSKFSSFWFIFWFFFFWWGGCLFVFALFSFSFVFYLFWLVLQTGFPQGFSPDSGLGQNKLHRGG